MSDRHVFYVGYFENNGLFASIQKSQKSVIALPKSTRGLDATIVHQLALDACSGNAQRVGRWDITVENDLIVFAEFTDPTAIQWVVRLVESMNMDVVDGTMRIVPKSELMAMKDVASNM